MIFERYSAYKHYKHLCSHLSWKTFKEKRKDNLTQLIWGLKVSHRKAMSYSVEQMLFKVNLPQIHILRMITTNFLEHQLELDLKGFNQIPFQTVNFINLEKWSILERKLKLHPVLSEYLHYFRHGTEITIICKLYHRNWTLPLEN